MTPELRWIVEAEIRRFLSRQARPVMLRDARLARRLYADRTVLSLIMVDGTEWHVELPRSGDHIQHRGGDQRLFSRDCVRLYSELLEDYLLELQLLAERQHLRLASENLDPEQVRHAYQEYEELERHARRHHRVRRDNPMMMAESTASEGGTLTLETMRRAMQALRRYSHHDDLDGSLPAMIVGVDWAADLGDERAQARALDLFKGRLSPAQLKQYETKKHFEVIGSDTGKRYRIRHGRQMNIDELDAKGERVCGWCFLPQGGLAAGDVMLAQKIALECDERQALKVANQFGVPGDRPIPLRPYGISPATVLDF